MPDHANLVYINKSMNMMVQRWKTTLGSYDFVKNIVADYLSFIVKNITIEEIRIKDELIILMLHHETKIPDEAYVKVKSVHNDIVGQEGVETTMSKLVKVYTP